MRIQKVGHILLVVILLPFLYQAEIVEPTVSGTLNVLRSCKKNPFLRRVVLTSSSSAVRVRDDIDSKVPLDESSWSSLKICESLQAWYALAKTQAEMVAWEFCNENKIDLVTVIPTFVIGPSLPPDLCSTASDVLAFLKGKEEQSPLHERMGYVHIDDIAFCHILVYEHEAANGRYLCNSTVVEDDELVSILSARYPSLSVLKRFKHLKRPYYEYNTSKIESLGFNFRSIEDMFEDCIKSLVEQGHLSL
ncbi:hypothetical protein DITRI_Ditri08aG0080500 [Diplodiscus trichospermus]